MFTGLTKGAVLSYKDNPVLRHYLKKLNDTPLLNRDEEEALVIQIEKCQNELMGEGIKYIAFLEELYDLLESVDLDPKSIINVSRRVDDKASKADIASLKLELSELQESMELGDPDEVIAEKAVALKFTGTHVNKIIQKIGKKYKKLAECRAVEAKLLDYFEQSNVDNLTKLIDHLKSDVKLVNYTAKKFFTTPGGVMSKIHEFEQYKLAVKGLESIGLDSPDRVEDLLALNKVLTKFEFDMKTYKNKLAQHNLRLVVSRAKANLNKGLDFEDLIQEGNIGLMKAIDRYDRSRGVKVSTYATWWIDQTIKRSISNKSRTVRIPTHIEFLQTQLLKATTSLTESLGRPPSVAELAEAVGEKESKLLSLQQTALHSVSLHDELGDGITLEDVLTDESENDPFEVTNNILLREKVRKIISTLSPRAEKIIRLRFGIGEPYETRTLEQIAGQIGLTKMGVKMAEKRALEDIRKKGELDE